MARCRGNKEDGSPCERIVGASQDYCYSHDPARADERQRNASRGGQAKVHGELTSRNTSRISPKMSWLARPTGASGRREPALQHPDQGHRAGAQDARARRAGGTLGGVGGSAEGKEGPMAQNSLHKAYDRLTPEERFRLDVLATARGDLEESERLTRTCQREPYTMNHRPTRAAGRSLRDNPPDVHSGKQPPDKAVDDRRRSGARPLLPNPLPQHDPRQLL